MPAYGSNKKASDLDELTTLASDDLIIVADTDDSSRAKKITKANLMTDFSSVNASEIVKGVVEEATDAQVLAGTATGETGAKLFVTPAKLATNLPSLSGGNLMFSATADENLTIGQPVGVSNNKGGYVAQADRKSTTATTSFTAVNGFGANMNPVCQIATDKFVFLDVQTADDTLYATVGTVTPATKTVALGISAAVTTDKQTVIYSVNKLDTDRFIVFYQETASNTLIKYRIGTVATSTITFGAVGTFATAASAYTFLTSEYLSTEKGVMVYKCATTADSRAIVFTTAGAVASAGTPKAMGTYTSGAVDTLVVKVGTDKFAIVSPVNAHGNVQIGTCTGTTTITLGSEVEFTTTITTTVDYFGAVSPTTDTLVIRYRQQVGNSSTDMIACTISGTTPTFGTIITGALPDNSSGSIYADTTSSVIISFGTTYIKRYTLSGTTLSNQGNIMQTTGISLYKFVSLGTYFVAGDLSSTTLSLYIEGMANGFIGIAQSTVSKGASVNVLYRGKDVNQNNLIPGGKYLVSNGAFTFVGSNVTVNSLDDINTVTALTSSQILL